MKLNMPCDRCSKSVDSTSTSSCSLGSIEIGDYLNIDKKRMAKLCSFDDRFFCQECMDEYLCVDCSKELTKEEKGILKAAGKI